MKTKKEFWEKHYKNLVKGDKIPKNNTVINETMGTANTLDNKYKKQLNRLIKSHNINNLDIIEFGPGFGGLAKELLKENIKSYTGVDNIEMLELFKRYIDDKRVTIINAEDIRLLEKKEFDLLISNYCLSETPIEYQQWVANNIFPYCKKIDLIDMDRNEGLFEKVKDVFDVNETIMPHDKRMIRMVGCRRQ